MVPLDCITDAQRKELRPLCRDCAHNKVCMYCIEDNQRDLSEKCALEYWEKYYSPIVVTPKTALTTDEYDDLIELLDKTNKTIRKIVKHYRTEDSAND